MNTVEFLDAVKRMHSLTSDYQAAQLLDLTRSQVSKYRSGKDFMGDEVAAKVAGLLGLEPGYVIACCHAERASSESLRAVWEGIAKKLSQGATAAAVLLCMLGVTGTPDAHAAAPGSALERTSLKIMSTHRISKRVMTACVVSQDFG